LDPSAPLDLLEPVVARLLTDARVWDSPRIADGVSALRLVERSDTRVRVCGRIWTITPSLESFDDPMALAWVWQLRGP